MPLLSGKMVCCKTDPPATGWARLCCVPTQRLAIPRSDASPTVHRRAFLPLLRRVHLYLLFRQRPAQHRPWRLHWKIFPVMTTGFSVRTPPYFLVVPFSCWPRPGSDLPSTDLPLLSLFFPFFPFFFFFFSFYLSSNPLSSLARVRQVMDVARELELAEPLLPCMKLLSLLPPRLRLLVPSSLWPRHFPSFAPPSHPFPQNRR